MAIDINNFGQDGGKLTTVDDGTIDSTAASINFVGRGYKGWGKPIQENLLWIMQNFAGVDEPPNPVMGQLWYDNNEGVRIIKVYNGTDWVASGGVITQNTAPGAANQGAFWYDNDNMQLHTWNGASWDLIGPLGSKNNADPQDPGVPPNSAIEAIQIRAVGGTYINLWRFTIGGQTFAILSKDPEFIPYASVPGFPVIKPGMNFDNRIRDLGLSNVDIIENTLPNIDNKWDLGSPAKRIANVYSYGSTVSNLQVQGTANFNNGGSTTVPPARWAAQTSLLATPNLGAVEFDGNGFYFTGRVNGVTTRQQPIFDQDLTTSNRLYVSTHGNDLNDGTSAAKSFLTIKAALAKASGGFTIFVEGGDYYENNPLYVPARVSIVGDNLRRTVVRPIHDQLDLFHVDVGTYFYGMTFKGHRAPAFCFAFPCSTATAVVGTDPANTVTFGKITEIKPTYSQSGYTVAPDVFVEAPPIGGTQATATAVIVDGAIVGVTVTNPGNPTGTTPYSALTIVTITGDTNINTLAQLRPRIVDGYIVAIDVINPGSGYDAPIGISIADTGGGTGATATATIGNGVIQRYQVTNAGSGYTRTPHVSVKPVTPSFITSSPYVQNCSSITGPFDINGKQITTAVSLPYDNAKLALYGFANLDPIGAGGGIRIDGEVLNSATVIRSFVADSFTQINQGGIGHLIINRGYAQFVSCFTTFSSIGYWARSGGFANISNSVVDFGDVGLKSEGYYPVAYATGTLSASYTSKVASVTLSGSGSGYTGNFTVNFTGGLGAGGVAAVGTAIVNAGSVVSVQIPSGTQGSGYISAPTIDWSLGAPGTGAAGSVNLLQNSNVIISGNTIKPANSSAMLLGGNFYTVISAANYAPNGATSWNVNIYPPLTAGTSGAAVAFHDVSNLSTGGLALEYVGSGVTYNALPVYGGVPDVSKQVVDSDTDATLKPGRVYYVTIDNTGNFKIGKFFSVNFADGSVSINSSSFNLTGLAGIGPFKRSGYAVGTNADEISDDPALTHPANDTYDHTTITTHSAVRQYLQQMSTSLVPSTNGTLNLGSSGNKWNNLYVNTVSTSTIGATTTNATTTNATTVNATTVNATTITGSFTGTLTSGQVTAALGYTPLSNAGGSLSGSLAITGALTVTGDITAFYTSDARLKTDLNKIPNALDKVSKLNGYTFNWKQESGKDQTVREAGVIAQEIETVLPEAVKTREDGYKGVDYEKLVPLLIEAIKDLRAEVELLKNK